MCHITFTINYGDLASLPFPLTTFSFVILMDSPSIEEVLTALRLFS